MASLSQVSRNFLSAAAAALPVSLFSIANNSSRLATSSSGCTSHPPNIALIRGSIRGSEESFEGMVSSLRGFSSEFILRPGIKVACIMALVQLARRIAVGAVHHAAALHGRTLKQRIGPALDVAITLPVNKFARAVQPAFHQPSIPGEDRHVGDS